MLTYDKESNNKNKILIELICLKELEEVQVLIDQLDFEKPFTAKC